MNLETKLDCKHECVWPKFDRNRAVFLRPDEVRKEFPRFCGTCPDCGSQVILYASWEHFTKGNW